MLVSCSNSDVDIIIKALFSVHSGNFPAINHKQKTAEGTNSWSSSVPPFSVFRASGAKSYPRDRIDETKAAMLSPSHVFVISRSRLQ